MMNDEKQPGSKQHRLYKSETDRIIDGVCGGIGEYFELDSNIVRLVLVGLSIINAGAGILFYIIGMIVIPSPPRGDSTVMTSEPGLKSNQKGKGAALAVAMLLIVIGVALLLNYYDFFSFSALLTRAGEVILPLLLILIGAALLLGRKPEAAQRSGPIISDEEEPYKSTRDDMRTLHRSSVNKKFFGVCGGLAEYFDVDPTFVRILFVILAIPSFGLATVLYFVLAFVMPKEKR
ncbi:MAG: PspC domain-containing protein [Candidatus Kryptoniota bacterium]